MKFDEEINYAALRAILRNTRRNCGAYHSANEKQKQERKKALMSVLLEPKRHEQQAFVLILD